MAHKFAWQKRQCSTGGHRAMSDRSCQACVDEFYSILHAPPKQREGSGIMYHPWTEFEYDYGKGGNAQLLITLAFVVVVCIASAILAIGMGGSFG